MVLLLPLDHLLQVLVLFAAVTVAMPSSLLLRSLPAVSPSLSFRSNNRSFSITRPLSRRTSLSHPYHHFLRSGSGLQQHRRYCSSLSIITSATFHRFEERRLRYFDNHNYYRHLLARTTTNIGASAFSTTSTELHATRITTTPSAVNTTKQSPMVTGMGVATITSPKVLAKAWTPKLLHKNNDDDAADLIQEHGYSVMESAVHRTVSLFMGGESGSNNNVNDDLITVPFVCRYRTDIIHPLKPKHVFEIKDMITKHNTLNALRQKLTPYYPSFSPPIQNTILTTTSKSVLDDIYAPYKPIPKGSIMDRIQHDYPKLLDVIDTAWKNDNNSSNDSINVDDWFRNYGAPRDIIVQILGTKIAAEPQLTQYILDEMKKYCRVQTKTVTVGKKKKNNGDATNTNTNENGANNSNKYSTAYGDFSSRLMSLKDYQVLAIRRGVKEKALKMSYDIDTTKMIKYILYRIRKRSSIQDDTTINIPKGLIQYSYTKDKMILHDSIQDAWTRLLRRRLTTRLWKEKCNDAQQRACYVFEDNLYRALLEPPLLSLVSQQQQQQSTPVVLALDPGYKAGIKCAILDPDGTVVKFETVQYIGSEKRKQNSIHKLQQLLHETLEQMLAITNNGGTDDHSSSQQQQIIIALGNGHGSRECRMLIQDAAKNVATTSADDADTSSSGFDIDIHLVNEAGASVWSVTEQAGDEFPNQPPASIAAASIGRRLQNPLNELIKIPPASLGLGMYQHDLSSKELNTKLHDVCIHAVATIGVDLNTCSKELLEMVPGISSSKKSLAQNIIDARPFQQRSDLISTSTKKIRGIGPTTYENCAGFVRVLNGLEVLDSTNVHPEAYELARWLLKQKQFSSWYNLLKMRQKKEKIPATTDDQQQEKREIATKMKKKQDDEDRDITTGSSSTMIEVRSILQNLPPRNEWDMLWKDTIIEASSRYNVSTERVVMIIEQLVDAISNEDPRLKLLRNSSSSSSSNNNVNTNNNVTSSRIITTTMIGSVESCKSLSLELSTIDQIVKAVHNSSIIESDKRNSSNNTSEELLSVAPSSTKPIRGIIGTVRNVADFGAFIDIGTENNGLLHKTKLGPTVQLQDLLIGQQIGIDILSVTTTGGDTGGGGRNTKKEYRISLGLHGCNFQPQQQSKKVFSSSSHDKVRGSSTFTSSSLSSGSKRSRTTKLSTSTKKRSISTKANNGGTIASSSHSRKTSSTGGGQQRKKHKT